MGREVRYVTADWKPHDEPQYDGLTYPDDLRDFEEGEAKWMDGLVKDWSNGGWKPKPESALECDSFEDWYGRRPTPDNYTSARPGDELTHIVMYENTSEGTPISPAFPIDQKEELAQWLEDNNASSFGSMTATKEQWLATIKGGWAPSAVTSSKGLQSGVEFVAQESE